PPFDSSARLPHGTGTISTLEFVPTSGPNQSRACSLYGFGVAQPQANGFDHAQSCHALGNAAVTRHRKFFCKRGSVNGRFAPKATEVLRCRKASLCARTGCEQSQQGSPYSITSSASNCIEIGTSMPVLGSLEIDHQFKFGGLLHRQIGGLLAFENPS